MGGYPTPPHGAQIRQKRAKKGQNWSKIGQKSAKIETESGRDGGWYPPPSGVKKSAIRAVFCKVKTETGPRFLGGSGPPYPHGVQNWPSIPPVLPLPLGQELQAGTPRG